MEANYSCSISLQVCDDSNQASAFAKMYAIGGVGRFLVSKTYGPPHVQGDVLKDSVVVYLYGKETTDLFNVNFNKTCKMKRVLTSVATNNICNIPNNDCQ